ncbi:hypothetical protein VNO78_18173 [Psophocarpus tetragonolobus]|uniref:Uncharacterized protein n=1 Tax=Psophocarpus tetragonolobus TaxID=3891 RepID=A0AAN9SK41_PSOTE
MKYSKVFPKGVKSNGNTAGSGVRSCGALMGINRRQRPSPFPHQTKRVIWSLVARSGLLPASVSLSFNFINFHSLQVLVPRVMLLVYE